MKGSLILLFMLYKTGGHDLTVEGMPLLPVITGGHVSGFRLFCIP
jgi:hypothetical protein